MISYTFVESFMADVKYSHYGASEKLHLQEIIPDLSHKLRGEI